MRLVIPAASASVLSMLTEIVNLIFIGHLEGKNEHAEDMISGVGLGNMT